MNNTIEQDDISTLERRIKELKSDNYNDQFLAVFKRIQAKLINHKKAIDTLKALESAEGLPEKKDADWHINGSEYGRCDEYFCSDMSEGFNQAIDLFQIPYAKQILKVKGLEKSISDVLTQRDMWKTDYAELQAENKKLKEQQLTEDAIAEIVLQTNKDWDNYEGFDNFELFIAKAIIKARSDKKKHTCGICGEYVDHEENDCPERINI